jgi:hypothetical protein
MLPSSASRGQTSPLVALVSVLVAIAAVTTYAIAFAGISPDQPPRDHAAPGLERAITSLASGSVVQPTRLSAGLLRDVRPSGTSARLSIHAGEHDWVIGPEPPDTASAAARVVPVRVGPNRVQLGRLELFVW